MIGERPKLATKQAPVVLRLTNHIKATRNTVNSKEKQTKNKCYITVTRLILSVGMGREKQNERSRKEGS